MARRVTDVLFKFAGYAISILAVGAFLAVPLYGIYHAFNKHSIGAGVVSLVFPPAAIFMAAEGYFFHERHNPPPDNSLISQGMGVLNMMNNQPSIDNEEFLSSAIEGFTLKFTDLTPLQQKDTIKALKLYDLALKSGTDDLQNAIIESLRTWTPIEESEVLSKKTKDALKNFKALFPAAYLSMGMLLEKSNISVARETNADFFELMKKRPNNNRQKEMISQLEEAFSKQREISALRISAFLSGLESL